MTEKVSEKALKSLLEMLTKEAAEVNFSPISFSVCQKHTCHVPFWSPRLGWNRAIRFLPLVVQITLYFSEWCTPSNDSKLTERLHFHHTKHRSLQFSKMGYESMPRENKAKIHFLKVSLWPIWTSKHVLVKHCKMLSLVFFSFSHTKVFSEI